MKQANKQYGTKRNVRRRPRFVSTVEVKASTTPYVRHHIPMLKKIPHNEECDYDGAVDFLPTGRIPLYHVLVTYHGIGTKHRSLKLDIR